MAFNVQLARTQKRRNEIENVRPLLNSCTVQVVLKNETSIIEPTFILQCSTPNGVEPTNVEKLFEYNYAYCETFHRYYWINNIVMITSTIAEIVCEVDVLRTFYDDIVNSGAFCTYAETEYNSMIPDTRIPKSDYSTLVKYETIPPYFDVTGVFIITAISSKANGKTGLAQSYVMTGEEIVTLVEKMFSNEILTQLSETFHKPTDSICGCMWLPLGKTYISSGAGTIQFGDSQFGQGSYAKEEILASVAIDIQVPYFDTKTNSCADYRNVEPYSEYSLWLPGVGLVEIPMVSLIGNGQGTTVPIEIEYSISITTGEINYRIYRVNNGKGIVLSCHGQLGVQLPTSIANNSAVSTAASLVSAGAGIAVMAMQPNSIPFMIGSTLSSATNALMSSKQNTYSARGNVGGFQNTDYYRTIKVFTKYYQVSDTPENIANTIGKPLFKKVPEINDLTGFAMFTACYIQTGLHQTTPATKTELDKIYEYLTGGVYIQ